MLAERRHTPRAYPLSYQAGGAQVIAAEREVHLADVEHIERAATDALEKRLQRIVLDLRAVALIGNPGLAALCGVLRRLCRREASIALVGADPRTQEVLALAGLEGVAFTKTVRRALAILDRDPPGWAVATSRALRAAASHMSPTSLPDVPDEKGHDMSDPDRSEGQRDDSTALPPTFSVAVEPQRDGVRIVPRGDLDLATAEQLQDQLKAQIDAGSARIEVDLRDVGFMDSTGLHALLTAHAQAQRDDWELSIIPGPRQVQRLFEITCTLERLPFTGDVHLAAAPSPKPSSAITSMNGTRPEHPRG